MCAALLAASSAELPALSCTAARPFDTDKGGNIEMVSSASMLLLLKDVDMLGQQILRDLVIIFLVALVIFNWFLRASQNKVQTGRGRPGLAQELRTTAPLLPDAEHQHPTDMANVRRGPIVSFNSPRFAAKNLMITITRVPSSTASEDKTPRQLANRSAEPRAARSPVSFTWRNSDERTQSPASSVNRHQSPPRGNVQQRALHAEKMAFRVQLPEGCVEAHRSRTVATAQRPDALPEAQGDSGVGHTVLLNRTQEHHRAGRSPVRQPTSRWPSNKPRGAAAKTASPIHEFHSSSDGPRGERWCGERWCGEQHTERGHVSNKQRSFHELNDWDDSAEQAIASAAGASQRSPALSLTPQQRQQRIREIMAGPAEALLPSWEPSDAITTLQTQGVCLMTGTAFTKSDTSFYGRGPEDWAPLSPQSSRAPKPPLFRRSMLFERADSIERKVCSPVSTPLPRTQSASKAAKLDAYRYPKSRSANVIKKHSSETLFYSHVMEKMLSSAATSSDKNNRGKRDSCGRGSPPRWDAARQSHADARPGQDGPVGQRRQRPRSQLAGMEKPPELVRELYSLLVHPALQPKLNSI